MEDKQRHPDDARLDGIRFPRWQAALALLAVGALYAVISDGLTFVPRVFVLGLVTVLLVPLMGAHRRGRHRLARWFGLGLVGIITVAVATSVFLLVSSLLSGKTPAPALLRDAALLWVINVVTFAVWYWEIDDGGPARRHRKAHASRGSLFPQTSLGTTAAQDWSPGFLDYLFLAFNTSTAFSPTDTAVLSQRAKLLTMLQALLSQKVRPVQRPWRSRLGYGCRLERVPAVGQHKPGGALGRASLSTAGRRAGPHLAFAVGLS